MKILIVSDSHGDVTALRTAVNQEKPDRVFHLGDVTSDAKRISAAFPDIPVTMVSGNCDAYRGETCRDELLETVEGVKFFLTHGHRYHVKMGMGLAVTAAKRAGADVLCFGHTHKSMCILRDGMWIVNPGTAGGVGSRASYAVAELENGTETVEIREL